MTSTRKRLLLAIAAICGALLAWSISLPGSAWDRAELVLKLGSCAVRSWCDMPVEGVYVLHDVPSEQWEQYRLSLPAIEGIAMPTKPQIRIGGMQVLNDLYLEGIVALRVAYEGVDYWWALVQPLNNEWGWKNGLPIGYPKTLEEMCRTYDGATFVYSFGGCDNSSLKLTHVRDPEVRIPDSAMEGQLTLATDGCLKTSESQSEPLFTTGSFSHPGRVTVENNYRQPWAALLPDGEYAGNHVRVIVRMNESDFGGVVLKCGVKVTTVTE